MSTTCLTIPAGCVDYKVRALNIGLFLKETVVWFAIQMSLIIQCPQHRIH